jgi:hypothetical protein
VPNGDDGRQTEAGSRRGKYGGRRRPSSARRRTARSAPTIRHTHTRARFPAVAGRPGRCKAKWCRPSTKPAREHIVPRGGRRPSDCSAPQAKALRNRRALGPGRAWRRAYPNALLPAILLHEDTRRTRSICTRSSS